MPRPQLEIIADIISALKIDISSVTVSDANKQTLIYLYNELFSTLVVSGVASVNGLTGIVPLTGTANRITISAGNVFDIGTDVVTLSGAQLLQNKTGNISQWTNDAGYITSVTGYVPDSRTLTINGTALDLSSDRSWSVGTVTNIATSGLISGGPISTTGTITTSMNTNKLVGRGSIGIGVMEEITLGTGLSFTGTTLNATASVTPAALTKIDDTNVTVTLGGSPTTALLQAASLTLGWTGQLSIPRGGHGQNTAILGFNALSPVTTRGDIIVRGATNNDRLALGSSGKILRSNGTDLVYSTSTFPDTIASGNVLHATSANIISSSTELTYSSGGLTVSKAQNAVTYLQITNTTSGTAAYSGIFIAITGSSGLVSNAFVANSASYITSGINVADTAAVRSSQVGGLNVGTSSNAQLSFWTNNTERARINASGDFIIENGFFYMKNTVSNTNYWKGALVSGVLTWTDTGSTTIP
ncbi:MAG TPA: hypothetical protein VL854_08355 [Nitrososphaeraceae archaeon]|nr:hypothetical protein [Nitrososphaeraceae archaeon]